MKFSDILLTSNIKAVDQGRISPKRLGTSKSWSTYYNSNFGAMYFYSIMAIGMKNLEKKWPEYRCNPMVLPHSLKSTKVIVHRREQETVATLSILEAKQIQLSKLYTKNIIQVLGQFGHDPMTNFVFCIGNIQKG